MNDEHQYSIIEAEPAPEESVGENAEAAVSDRMPTVPQLLVAIGMLVLLLGASYLPHFSNAELETAEVPEEQTAQTITPAAPEPIKDAFEEIALNAQAVYVWDIKQQRALYKHNPDAQLPLASLTKLMTALVAHEVLDDTAPIEISLRAIQEEGESGFLDGDVWETKKLLDYTLMTSSNDGAYALAAAAGAALTMEADPADAFVAAMNVRAEQLGLSQTYFTNPTGLDASESQSGSYGSARDMAFLMEYLVTRYPELLSETTEPAATIESESGLRYTATNTNQHVTDIPGLIGSKTGYTLLAGGNLVVAFEAANDRPVVIAVLGSTREGRFEDVNALVAATKVSVAEESAKSTTP